jgi:predicted Zn-dependent protease
VLDWLGLRALNEVRYELARDSYRRLCGETPLPRAFKLWGASALIAGSPRESRDAFRRLLARAPEDPVGWYGLWISAAVAGDTTSARRASERVLGWEPEGREMREVVEFFEAYPRLYAVVRQVTGTRDSQPR